MHIIIGVSAVSFNPFVLLLKGFLQLLGSVAEWGPVFNVSLELFWTAGGYGSWNVLHLTNWAFNRTHGLPNPPKRCKHLRLWTKTGKFDQPGPENNYLKNIREAIKVCRKDEWKFPFRNLIYSENRNIEKKTGKWKITLVFTPPIPWNGNFHSFSIFSTLMASISELCRGLFVPSAYKNQVKSGITKKYEKKDNILFVFPHHTMKPDMTTLGRTDFKFFKHIQLAENKITNRWVKLSIGVERQLTGYVSIKLRERSLV